MTGVIGYAEELLYFVIEWGILLLELFGVVILAFTSVSCFIKWIRKEKNIRLELAQGITLALSFKMGGEVLRTVVVREWEELGILGAIIVLRAALTFLLHWEIENEKDVNKKKALFEELMNLYDLRIKYFGNVKKYPTYHGDIPAVFIP